MPDSPNPVRDQLTNLLTEALCAEGGHTVERYDPSNGDRLEDGVSIGRVLLIPSNVVDKLLPALDLL